MQCWNCGEEVSDEAEFCRYCEADLREKMPEGSEEILMQLLEEMDEESRAQLREAFENSDTGHEFVTRIMVGDCPACGSDNVDDCEHDTQIEDITVGQCFDCGHLWCLECGEPLERGATECDHWKICEQCEQGQQEFGCMIMTLECEKIVDWIERRHREQDEGQQ
jgi:hypothetical protein